MPAVPVSLLPPLLPKTPCDKNTFPVVDPDTAFDRLTLFPLAPFAPLTPFPPEPPMTFTEIATLPPPVEVPLIGPTDAMPPAAPVFPTPELCPPPPATTETETLTPSGPAFAPTPDAVAGPPTPPPLVPPLSVLTFPPFWPFA